jgi:hypothetical protein
MMPDDDYDWADDDTLSAEETMQIFEALGPDEEVTGPPESTIPAQFRPTASLTSAYGAHTTTNAPPPLALVYDPACAPTG